MKCPKCESGNIDTKYHIDDSREGDEREYLVASCRDCTHRWTTYEPDDVQEHMDTWGKE